MSRYTRTRNAVIGAGYRGVVRPICFQFDAEKVHKTFIRVGRALGSSGVGRKVTKGLFLYKNKMLEQELAGIKFANPIGLSAGFDKNAEVLNILGSVGFGFAEAGSVTANACEGNPGKRLKRIVKEKSIWVNLGLNNRGADEISSRLRGKNFGMPFAVSVAKTNCKETVDPKVAVEDYCYSIEKFRDIGEFYVINISCPNAFGGQPFNDPKLYEMLLKKMSTMKIKKPIFAKFSPDTPRPKVKKLLALSAKYGVSGIVCSNLTKRKDAKTGGFSGGRVSKKADDLLKFVALENKKRKYGFILVGVGGVFSAEDAYRKIRLGANLVEMVTGMIFEGPQVVGSINEGLVKLLKRDGFKSVSEAVGADIPKTI